MSKVITGDKQVDASLENMNMVFDHFNKITFEQPLEKICKTCGAKFIARLDECDSCWGRKDE